MFRGYNIGTLKVHAVVAVAYELRERLVPLLQNEKFSLTRSLSFSFGEA